MIHVVLYEPEIPPNTGNIIRLCANTGAFLHLIEPLGFRMEDAQLRRAGLDYHEYASVRVHPSWPDFLAAMLPARVFAMTTRGQTHPFEVRFAEGDVLLFGPESRGLPQGMVDGLPAGQRLRLPMREGSRSLNLSNAVAVTVYEAWRQLGFRGAV
ncbi:MAG: tRNA (uridine(34)/cytosine(34)/5-carboxymethylaminomethyluridine(34)-2'-O)-methyltransferase TrmL [Halothiobacillaceae bacterium]